MSTPTNGYLRALTIEKDLLNRFHSARILRQGLHREYEYDPDGRIHVELCGTPEQFEALLQGSVLSTDRVITASLAGWIEVMSGQTVGPVADIQGTADAIKITAGKLSSGRGRLVFVLYQPMQKGGEPS